MTEDEIMIIPWQELDPDTLNNLLEHFVLQEGTEYGEQDVSLADKYRRLLLHNVNPFTYTMYPSA